MEGRKKKNGKKSVDNKLLRSVTGYARDTRCDDRESWGQKCFSLLFLKGRREEGGSHARDLIRRQGRTRVSRIPAAQLVEILLTTIRKYRTVKEEEKEKRVSTKPFPSSTLADTGCYATHELDAMHSGWACEDFIITSSLPTECIRIEKCAGLFFSYRGYRDNARMPVTRARIHPSFGREREREREIPLVSLTPVTLLLFFPPWISSCARRTVDVRRKGGRRIPLAEGQRQRERERGRSGVIWG